MSSEEELIAVFVPPLASVEETAPLRVAAKRESAKTQARGRGDLSGGRDRGRRWRLAPGVVGVVRQWTCTRNVALFETVTDDEKAAAFAAYERRISGDRR
jgi:hypothetical protein